MNLATYIAQNHKMNKISDERYTPNNNKLKQAMLNFRNNCLLFVVVVVLEYAWSNYSLYITLLTDWIASASLSK